MRLPISEACRGASWMKAQIVFFVINCQHQMNKATSPSQPIHMNNRARGVRWLQTSL